MSRKKRVCTIALFGLLTSTAFANNNSGEIVVQGVVPDTWEVTMYNINPDTYFTVGSLGESHRERIGTIHMYGNGMNSVGGQLFIESENSGKLKNSSTDPAIASESQKYEIKLEYNNLNDDGATVYDRNSTLSKKTLVGYDLVVPVTVDLEPENSINKIVEEAYDVHVLIPDMGRPQASVVYTDTITFTIIDDN